MSKLHPIYVALDSHQYGKAAKLASALPDSNVLGKALLAHAYSKAGQKYMSMVTLNKVLGGSFPELRFEVETALEAFQEREQQASNPTNATDNSASSVSKKGKKGKKKPAPTPKPAAPTKPNTSPSPDLLEHLNKQPLLPENWEQLPPATQAITDEVSIFVYNGEASSIPSHSKAHFFYRQFLELWQ